MACFGLYCGWSLASGKVLGRCPMWPSSILKKSSSGYLSVCEFLSWNMEQSIVLAWATACLWWQTSALLRFIFSNSSWSDLVLLPPIAFIAIYLSNNAIWLFFKLMFVSMYGFSHWQRLGVYWVLPCGWDMDGPSQMSGEMCHKLLVKVLSFQVVTCHLEPDLETFKFIIFFVGGGHFLGIFFGLFVESLTLF